MHLQGYLEYVPAERHKPIVSLLQYHINIFPSYLKMVASAVQCGKNLTDSDLGNITSRNVRSLVSKRILTSIMVNGHHSGVPSYSDASTVEEFQDIKNWFNLQATIDALKLDKYTREQEIEVAEQVQILLKELLKKEHSREV